MKNRKQVVINPEPVYIEEQRPIIQIPREKPMMEKVKDFEDFAKEMMS